MAVEKIYSRGLYPYLGKLMRLLFGWIPFSIGDLLYAAGIVYILYHLVRLIRKIFRREADRSYLLGCLRRTAWILLAGYLVFNFFWGLNYNRIGIARQLELDLQPYSPQQLDSLVVLIVSRLNQLDSNMRLNTRHGNDAGRLFPRVEESYFNLAEADHQFAYAPASIKPSLYGFIGNWLGFSGYYNPFTGEAQVNTGIPRFELPFTSCHEVGHQLGYARENEANFLGYLAAKSSPHLNFKYSAYFDLYLYAGNELYFRDSSLLQPIRQSLSPGVREDILALKAYYQKYQNPFEPYLRRLYGRFLRANQQPAGINSYNEVVLWLMAYYRKNGAGAL